MLRYGINCIKFYWFGIFCSSIMGIVVSTFLDYRVLFSKGDFYTWRVSFTIFVISVTVSDIIMLQVTALSRFLYLRIRYSIKCTLWIFNFKYCRQCTVSAVYGRNSCDFTGWNRTGEYYHFCRKILLWICTFLFYVIWVDWKFDCKHSGGCCYHRKTDRLAGVLVLWMWCFVFIFAEMETEENIFIDSCLWRFCIISAGSL